MLYLIIDRSASKKLGYNFNYVWNIEKLLNDNKFTNIHADYISLPLNWGGRMGVLYGECVRLAGCGLMAKIAPIVNLTQEEYSQLIDTSMVLYRENKSWNKATYVYAMKPLNV